MRKFLRNSVERRAGGGGGKAWKADYHKLLVCDNGKDNAPETFSRGSGVNDPVYFISQSRSPGHKDVGQDAMAVAQHQDWECHVLCDGHDRDGHMVAREVCRHLPNIVLRKVFERTDMAAEVTEELLVSAFRECADDYCWTTDDVVAGMFVKVFGSMWDGKVGFLGETKESNSAVVIIVDDSGYHRPVIEKKHLKRSKFTGGCTCVCLLRNVTTGEARIAVTGDSRVLMLNSSVFEDPILRPVFGIMDFDSKQVPPMGMTTPAHNVFNKDELLRLNTHHAGSFDIEGAFLVNPVTKFSIQPTRGFGDFDMFGTGYIDIPEVSSTLKLKAGTVLFVASDGVFDDHVWHDDEIVSFFDEHMKPSTSSMDMGHQIYKETLDRSLEGGYVDDISFFMFVCPETDTATTSVGSSESTDAADDGAATAAAGEAESEKAPDADSKEGARKSGRKSLFGGLMKKKSQRAPKLGKMDSETFSRSTESIADIDDDRIRTKPDIEAPNPEDRRKTIDRKDRGSFTELSNFLKDALASRKNKPEDGEEEQTDEELANIVLGRFASQHGVPVEDVKKGRDVSADAAQVAKRLSSKRGPKEEAEEEEDDEES
ncbi:PPM-type phosphatase domain-containing protein [Durusdinium trenchii]|uniref:PPM-type phosphatase domain-containing protein n=1 Tax=Durusdinium trenchii TaxID=1381693 RepID=A0ABP0QJT5_9DINO